MLFPAKSFSIPQTERFLQLSDAFAATAIIADVVLYISHNASGRLERSSQALQGQDSHLIPDTCCEVERSHPVIEADTVAFNDPGLI